MNAQEARNKALASLIKGSGSQLEKIKTVILNATNEGEFNIFFYEHLKPGVREKLQDEGYMVGVTQQYRSGEIITRISWSNPSLTPVCYQEGNDKTY